MALSVWNKNSEMLAWDNKASIFDEYNFCAWWMLEEVKNFDYTWAEQSYSVKQSWRYKLQVWWAEWWYARGSASYKGWRWWYAEWIIQLAVWETLYAYVWWRWANWTTSLTGAAFNGWWKWWYSAYSGSDWRNWWWWGGTDLRIWWNTLYHRVIVAWWGWGGTPNKSQSNAHWGWNEWWYDYSWKQWTQTWGNAFWVWGSSSSNGEWNRYSVPGWWGWWYWAKAQTWGSSSDNWSDSAFYTAWWSWFVWTGQSTVPSWYLVQSKYILDLVKNIAWSQSHESVNWWTETGHLWNWYARISAMWLKKVVPTYVTSAWAYHNPDLWLISISADWENWITISDKNVWATAADPENTDSYWDIFQYWNIYHFAWEWSGWTVTTEAQIPDLTGYEWWNLYSNDKYRTNIDWNAANKKLWKPVAFANLLSLQKGPCDRWFHIPSAEEWTAVLNAILELEWEEAEFSYDLIARYLLMAHPNARKGDWDFYSSNTSIYFTNSYIENQNKINAFVMIWDEWDESGWLSATDMNCWGYIRWFRDVAMVPTTEWERIGGGWSTVRLPLEYQEVEYIESTGTQWINTWYIPKSTSEFELKFQNVSKINTYRTIIWTRKDTSNNAFWIWYMDGKCYYELSPANTEVTDASIWWFNTWVDYLLEFKNKRLTNNWNVVNSSVNFTNNALYSLFLFAWQAEGKTNPFEAAASKIYYLKLFESWELVHDYVPCYRRIDWAVWMYDLVNNQFYANAWSWSFLKWADVNIPELPEQYTEVEYLQSNWNQYIDTKVTRDVCLTPFIRYEFQTDSSQSWSVWFLWDWTTWWYIFWFSENQYRFVAWWTTWWQSSWISYSTWRHTFRTNASNWYLDWTQGSWNSWNMTIYRGSIYLFRAANFWVPAWNVKVYSCLIWNSNDNLIHYYIPCVRNSDSKPGLYDLITKEFLVNDWTGEFEIWLPNYYKVNNNTVAYYKFDNNVNDSSWNGRNFSMKGWSFSYWKVWIVKYVNFPESAWTNWISSFPFNSVSYTRCFWMKFPNYSKTTSWYYWIVLDFWRSSSSANPGVSRIENKNWKFTCDTIEFTPSNYDEWHMYTLINTNWVTKLYIDWEYVWEWTWGINTNVTDVTLAFNNAPDTNAAQYAWRWQMALLICEKWEWSLDFLKDYYKKTKVNFIS